MTKREEQGKRFAEVLEALGLNPNQFAKKTTIQQSHISVALKGRVRGISAGMIQLMLEAFPNININRIYTGIGPVLFDFDAVQENQAEYKRRIKEIADELEKIAKD